MHGFVNFLVISGSSKKMCIGVPVHSSPCTDRKAATCACMQIMRGSSS